MSGTPETQNQGAEQNALVPNKSKGAVVPAGEAAHPNFFAPIAVLMNSIPASLEAQGPSGGAPRYVRVARLREFLIPVAAKDEKLAGMIANGTGYFIQGMAYVMKYTLKLQDLLVQGDAGKALLETALLFAKKVTEPEFLSAIQDLNDALLEGPPLALEEPMGMVRTNIGKVEKYIGFIPEPRDLDVIGQQLYKMLVIEWAAAPTTAADNTPGVVVDMTKTGKLRLMLWALNRPFEPLDTGEADVRYLKTLGQRRLRTATTAAPLALSSTGSWTPDAGGDAEIIFKTTFETKGADIVELQKLLLAYGYPLEGKEDGGFDAVTVKAVKQFQKMNGLMVNGEVDLPTVNQLFHLRYDPDQAKGGLRKAKRYNAEAVKDIT